MTQPMKLCRDCVHFLAGRPYTFGNPDEISRCANRTLVDVVTGNESHPNCYDERGSYVKRTVYTDDHVDLGPHDRCGNEGKHWTGPSSEIAA